MAGGIPHSRTLAKGVCRGDANQSINASGHLESFDFFILSNTRDLDLWVKEEVAWTNFCRKLGGFGRIYYRRRKTNDNRKAGNIGDFVRTWGGGYEAMLVLDADSLMDGADIVSMARVMEAALMVAEGWEVWLAWDIEGTYEEAPPTLVDQGFIFLLLFLPKILAVVRAVVVPSARKSFGGALPVIASSWLESFVSMLLAPCIMAAHTVMVLGIVLARSVGWGNQNREADGTSWPDAIRFHAFPVVLGIGWTALAISISPVWSQAVESYRRRLDQ